MNIRLQKENAVIHNNAKNFDLLVIESSLNQETFVFELNVVKYVKCKQTEKPFV